jgi:hypothetical protein
MSFMLWCLLSVLYRQVVYLTGLEEENDDLRDEVADLKGLPRPPRRFFTHKFCTWEGGSLINEDAKQIR